MPRSVSKFLTINRVEASAPCRIDSGGTWDIRGLALPFQSIGPVTINAAINLRTTVTLSPYQEGQVNISSEGFDREEALDFDRLTFDSPFGLFFGAVSWFGFHGLHIRITSQSPVRSALGGSSTALVALVKALSILSRRLGGKAMQAREILHLSYHLEDAMAGGYCGMQDQAAAVYGGVHQWKWNYGDSKCPYKKTRLLDREGEQEFSRRLLVAFSGKQHVSAHINHKWIKDFLSGRTRKEWIKVNEIVKGLGRSIEARDWGETVRLLREEMALRREFTPESLIPLTEELALQAEGEGCGARFTGAGKGGAMWAFGPPDSIERLRDQWGSTLSSIEGARILDCAVDPRGAL
ncbi:MAG: hypothetical protein V2J25_03360 [Desulfatiglans sp.]|jgi:D-glycero-alpha-D-manno-heptose-7-phosphate kinase|nr:hypothetical protein [Desulfatiglans sp.]